MRVLEREILDRVQKLDELQQQQVLKFLDAFIPKTFDAETWFKNVEQFQAELHTKYGTDYTVDTQSLLDELREEASWPRTS